MNLRALIAAALAYSRSPSARAIPMPYPQSPLPQAGHGNNKRKRRWKPRDLKSQPVGYYEQARLQKFMHPRSRRNQLTYA